jgi:hypothetical protein
MQTLPPCLLPTLSITKNGETEPAEMLITTAITKLLQKPGPIVDRITIGVGLANALSYCLSSIISQSDNEVCQEITRMFEDHLQHMANKMAFLRRHPEETKL